MKGLIIHDARADYYYYLGHFTVFNCENVQSYENQNACNRMTMVTQSSSF